MKKQTKAIIIIAIMGGLGASFMLFNIIRGHLRTEEIVKILKSPEQKAVVASGLSKGLGFTQKAKDLLETEQDFTKCLYNIYSKDKKTYPEAAFSEIIQELGVERVKAILSKYEIDDMALQGLILVFKYGVKYENYLKERPF